MKVRFLNEKKLIKKKEREFNKELKKEIRELKKIGKKVVGRKILRKLRRVKDKEEKLNLLKYLIRSFLEVKFHKLEMRKREIEKLERDFLPFEIKMKLLDSKIKVFLSTFNKEDFKKVNALFKEVNNEFKRLRR